MRYRFEPRHEYRSPDRLASQPRHAGHHLREPDGHRRLRVRRSPPGRPWPGAARVLPEDGLQRGAQAQDYRYRQGDVNFLVNEDPDSFASDFAEKHGPCACGIRFKKPGQEVYQTALGNGAEAIAFKPDSKAVSAPVIKGIGDCMLYLVDRYGSAGGIYDGDYEPIAGADLHPVGFGLTFIDHLTHNLYFGNMQQWSDYYERLFNFREIRYFDIKGLKTGLVSKAMTAPDGIVRIPLNESSDPKSQINEYLDAYKGEGIQHIACFTENIYDTVEAMRAQGVDFLDTPETYRT